MTMESETVARGIVRGIVPGSGTGQLVSVRRGEQLRCPRCHGEDLTDAVPCPACGIKFHPDCLSQGCVSFNCRIVGTVVGGTGDTFELADTEWSDWEDAPAGSRLVYSERFRGRLHGPSRPVEDAGWRWSGLGGAAHGPCPLVPQSDYYWRETSWYEEKTLVVTTYRLLETDQGAVGAEVEAYPLGEDPEEDLEEYTLVTEERLSAEYEAQIRDGDMADWINQDWILDQAMEAVTNRGTFDGAAIFDAEVESRMENMDLSELAEQAGLSNFQSDVEASAPLLALLGFSPDGMGQAD